MLWITCEDISPDLSFYGDNSAYTPNLNAFAAQSTVYQNAFATTGVCGPSRSSIITGMYPTTIGTMHMRTGKDVFSYGTLKYSDNMERFDLATQKIREYSAVIPEHVRCFTDYLRLNGYYCTNDAKTDYQFAAPLSAWDENKNGATWKNRKPGQAFFSVINLNHTHESRLFLEENKTPLQIDVQKIPLFPYLTSTDSMKWTIARYYTNLQLLDKAFGEIIEKLKKEGLYDDTVIFFFSDHGGPLPKRKREGSDNGLKVPLVIKYPGQIKQVNNYDLVSLVDMGPTVLSLTGIKPPKYMEGQSIAGTYQTKTKRKYIYGHGDRFDEYTDRVRAIRDERYLYVKNFIKGQRGYKDLKYRHKIPGMLEMKTMYTEGKLDKDQAKWFEIKPEEELYDVVADPHQLHNLVGDKKYSNILKSMRKMLQTQLKNSGDFGAIPES